jgi:hypothetical protein
MGFDKVIGDVQDTKDQIVPSDETGLVLKMFSETQAVDMSNVTVEITKTNIGHAFIVGHATNGVIGTALGVDGSQITIGSGGLGASSVERVVNTKNTFVEQLSTSTFIDSSRTTATFDEDDKKLVF